MQNAECRMMVCLSAYSKLFAKQIPSFCILHSEFRIQSIVHIEGFQALLACYLVVTVLDKAHSEEGAQSEEAA